MFCMITTICCYKCSASDLSDEQLVKIRDGYELRRKKGFELLKGKPLIREKVVPPIFLNGSNFSRYYSYSLIDYAFKCFWLKEQLDSANAALLENAQYYINYPRAFKDKDSFYWGVDELCSILELFGSHGTKEAGLVRKDVEEIILFMMFEYSKMQSKISKAEFAVSKTWYIDESENHHVQRFYAAWHFAKFLKDHPLYRDQKYDDGFNAEYHYSTWNKYIKYWIVERAKKGLFVEMANDSYGLETLKGVYNFYGFGDLELKELSKKLLDLYWAVWAQEQLGGVRGGAKSRIYPYDAYNGRTTFWKMAWYYLGINEKTAPHENLFTLVTSQYRMPLIVMDIALDNEGRGIYEITQRRQGAAEIGFFSPPDYRLKPNGELLRYSFCSPEFIAGTFFCPAKKYEEWALISSQNRWAGVIFKDNPNARIYVNCKTGKDDRAYNQFWCVQSKGCMVVHKLQDTLHSRGAQNMRVWISKVGFSKIVEKNGWVFTTSDGAYTAIKPVVGGYQWEEDENGRWIVLKEKYSPVIIEVVRKSDFSHFWQFQIKILSSQPSIINRSFSHETVYGDVLSFPLSYDHVPVINGKQVDLSPTMVMESPFIKSKFDSGVFEIVKGSRQLTLVFTS